MGGYRYLLSLLVLVSHTGLRPANYGIGISAVVSFFILSGYVMTLLVERHYASAASVPLFYLDRCARIFPQYLLYLVLTIVLAEHWQVVPVGASGGCDVYQIALNVAVLPLNWSHMATLHCFYLPQAWSLALELTFYLVVPFLIASRQLTRAMVVLSVAVFMAAVAALIDPETFGYRTLPGTLFMFVAGMALARRDLMPSFFPRVVWMALFALLAVLSFDGGLMQANVSRDVILGFVIGLPVVAALRRLGPSKLDEMLGNLSYGLFLNHVLCISVLEQKLGFRIDSIAHLIVLIGVATLLSFSTYQVIERPILALRRGLRTRQPNSPVAHAPQTEAQAL